MKRLFDYFKRYNITDKNLQQFLYKHGRIRHYREQAIYPQDEQSVWCFIIEGAVALEYDASSKIVIDCVYIRHDYFTSDEHVFTQRGEEGQYVFLEDSIIYEIDSKDFQYALSAFHLLERMFNILKQHQLNLTRHLVRVIKIPSEERIHYMYKKLPMVLHKLNVAQRRALLNISNNREYYKALRYWQKK